MVGEQPRYDIYVGDGGRKGVGSLARLARVKGRRIELAPKVHMDLFDGLPEVFVRQRVAVCSGACNQLVHGPCFRGHLFEL